jgi:predicted transcriptional regulator
MKAIEDLFRRIEQLPLVDKDNGARLPAEFALIKDDDIRRLHHTFPDVATAAGRLKHRKTNASLRNILIHIFRTVWPDIVDAVDVSEYDDDNSEFHIRDALSNIVERFPFAVATLKAIEAHCFKGASLTNSEMRAAIETYRIPNAATMSESHAHNTRLDDLRYQWRAVEQQPGVGGTSGERYDDLLNKLDQRSQNDRVGLNYQAFIIEHRKLPVSTKTLPLLIKNLKTWVHEQILHRQATQKGGTTVISANAITGTCPMHPGANHTAADCRGLKAKTQGASSTNKTYVHKNQGQDKTKKYHGKGKERSLDEGKVRFDQDKGKAGSRYQGSSSFKRSYNPPNRTSGPQHPGGSLEDLLTGGYKGRKFDPAKSRKYKELQAYFTRQDIASTAGAAASTSGNGANAAGQANAVFGAQGFDPRNPFALPFAFHVSIGTPKEVQVGEIIQTLEMDEDSRSLMNPGRENHEPRPRHVSRRRNSRALHREKHQSPNSR